MQDTEKLLGLLRERGKRGLPLQRVYRQLYNTNLYLSAYGRIYRNAGAMTPGVTEETADGTGLETFGAIIAALKQERYQWQPARRTYIAKKNGKKRPLGLPVWSDKLLAEGMRMILDAYFDGTFSEHSHGFREGRGCHTALREIYHSWNGTTWIIEGDIADCFGSLDHDLIISALAEHIQDGRFLNLVRRLLDAGYMENWKWNATFSGTPQGSILSPVLANILLAKLDRFVERELMPQYNRGKRRRENREYGYLINRASVLRKRKGQKEAAQHLKRQAQKLPSKDPQDPDYRRLRYIRYADDFALAFIGPKKEAEAIKQRLRTFLLEELKLNLSEEKTVITHTRDNAAHFLNYEITTLQCNTKQSLTNGHTRRNINGVIGLKIPHNVVEDKCKRYMRKGKPMHRAELLHQSDFTIVATYQLEYRGLVNYYRMAFNLRALEKLKWIMETSLTKTLAYKHKISVRTVYQKYRAELDVNGKKYKGLQVIVPREGKKPLIATWGGIPLIRDTHAPIEDKIARSYGKRTELEQRLLAQVCEQCGATRMTDQIEVHHIRALKDLEKYTGREKPQWVQIMAARRRKTLVLCHTCHVDIQYGRPHRRKVSRSRTGET